jgi:drug/metabolite transporter (DMT)-like permease
MMHFAPQRNTSLSRSLLAGLACGILAALLNVLYTYFYRTATEFSGSMLFEPLVIFIAFPLLFLVGGFLFFEMVEFIKKGRLFFTVFFLLLMLIAAILGINNYGKEMEGLLLGIIAITGLLMSFLLPFLATHARIFMDQEEFTESAET